jgi:glycosyltransferase involved in cell wall biosynthesis
VYVFDEIPDAAPGNDLRPAFADAGIPVAFFPKPPGFSFRTILRIHRKLSAENIATLHTHDLGALMYGVCAKLLLFGRVRLIHTQHSFVHLSRRWIYKHYERFFVRFADEITVVSGDTAQSYVELGVPRRKVHVVPNGVRFPEGGAVSVDVRKNTRRNLHGKLDPSSRAALEPFLDCRWILYMARLHRTKGQDHALKLWERLSARARSNAVLLFVGPESEAGRLDQLRSDIETAPDSRRILYMGTTHCPDLWLNSSDLALSCSEFEGMPLGPIEAAGAGLPMVLSEIPGHAVVKSVSLQFPLGDPSKGARLVDRMLEELATSPNDYFNRAWETGHDIRSRYTLGHMCEAYSGLYHPEVRSS